MRGGALLIKRLAIGTDADARVAELLLSDLRNVLTLSLLTHLRVYLSLTVEHLRLHREFVHARAHTNAFATCRRAKRPWCPFRHHALA